MRVVSQCVVRCFAEWRCANVCAVGHPLLMRLCVSVYAVLEFFSSKKRCAVPATGLDAGMGSRMPNTFHCKC